MTERWSRGALAALAAELIVLAMIALVGLDLAAHRRTEQRGGVNVWGYRGAVMRQKAPREIRIAVAGGDLAFGWGVAAGEALPAHIRQLVALETDQPGRPLRPVTAVTLGAVGLDADEYGGWMQRYASLAPDIICLVADPNRPMSGRRGMPNRRSRVFGAFGYAPMLPLVMQEKGRVSGRLWLERIGAWFEAVDGGNPPLRREAVESRRYASSLAGAARSALRIADAGVVVVLPPYRSAAERADHLAVIETVGREDTARLRLVDLAEAGDLDDTVQLNAVDFSTAGHARAAGHVVPAVMSLLAARESRP